MPQRRAFTLIEMLVVIGLLSLFATIVIPGLSAARLSSAPLLEGALDADLRLARSEALARGREVLMMHADDGTAWWLAESANPDVPLEGTLRELGRGTLNSASHATLAMVTSDESLTAISHGGSYGVAHGVARFDALGSRDEGTLEITLTEKGAASESWTLAAGRTRLHRDERRTR